MAWNAENFPRRAAGFRFQVCDFTNGAFRTAAAFDLPNPVRHKYSSWKPEPLPINRRRGGLQFEAVNFSKGAFVDEPWLSQSGRPQLRTGYVALLQVKQDGLTLENWQVEQATVLDPTGNRINPRVPPSPSSSIGGFLVFGLPRELTPLWPSEDVWKIIPQFTRTGGFASNELFLLSAIPIPTANGVLTQILARAEANGVSVAGVEMKLMGTSFWIQRIRQNLQIEPFLAQRRPDRHLSLFEVKDDRGRRLQHDQSYFNTDGKHFGIELLPDSKSLDLTFAVQEPVTVEYVVTFSPTSQETR